MSHPGRPHLLVWTHLRYHRLVAKQLLTDNDETTTIGKSCCMDAAMLIIMALRTKK